MADGGISTATGRTGDDGDKDVTPGDSPQDFLPPIVTAAQGRVHPSLVAEYSEVLHQLFDSEPILTRVRDEYLRHQVTLYSVPHSMHCGLSSVVENFA
jgi:hypothetical protein